MEFRGAEKPYQFLASSSSHFASYETARSQFSTDDFWASVRSVKQDQGKRVRILTEVCNHGNFAVDNVIIRKSSLEMTTSCKVFYFRALNNKSQNER